MRGRWRLAYALVAGPGVAQPADSEPVAIAGEPDALDLTWSAPSGCPDRAAVVADVASLVEPGARLDAVAVVATVTREGVDHRLDLHVRTIHGELSRSFHAKRCATLARTTALHVVLAASEQAPTPPPPEPPPPQPRAPPPPPKRSPTVRGALAIGGAVGYGALTVVTPEVNLGLALLGRRFRVALDVAYAVPRKISARGEPSVAAQVQSTYASVRGCPRFGFAKLDVLPCVALEAGALRVQGHGVIDSRTVRAPWLASAVGLGLAWAPIPAVALWTRAELVVPWLYPRFDVDGLGPMTRVRPVHGRLVLGVEWRFPGTR